MTTILFNPSTYSYLSVNFALDFNAICDVLDILIHVSNLVGDSIIITHIYRPCFILFMGFQMWADLVILEIDD